MASTRNSLLASQHLASVAPESCNFLLKIAIATECSVGSQVAYRIQGIGEDLSEQELYELPESCQILSLRALQDLVEISKWPTLSSGKRREVHLKQSAQDLRDALVEVMKTGKSKDRAHDAITKFCKQKPEAIVPFQTRFVELSDQLTENAKLLQGGISDIDVAPHLKPLDRDIYPSEAHQLFLDQVKKHAVCVQGIHPNSTPLLRKSLEPNWHITGLCLKSGFTSDHPTHPGKLALFNVIVASWRMAYWQEVAIGVPIKVLKPGINPKSQDDTDSTMIPSTSGLTRIEHGAICTYIETQPHMVVHLDLGEDCHLYERSKWQDLKHLISGSYIRLSELLETAKFDDRHKINLSYIIARAFWQFYTSELMDARWTSEDIFFVPLNEALSASKGIPLRAFVSFPFGSQYIPSPSEFDGRLSQTFPRILYLGIILLEIGLGRPMDLKIYSNLPPMGRISVVSKRAEKMLEELKSGAAEWNGICSKEHFVKAVQNCLDPSKFMVTPKSGKIQHSGDSRQGNRDAKDSSLSGRRNALYRHVVRPLFWLATEGLEESEEVPVIQVQEKPPTQKKRRHISTPVDSKELQDFWRDIRTQASFHSGHSSGTIVENFFQGLQRIAEHIAVCRKLARIRTPVRVAILDTGCKIDLPCFNRQRLDRLKGWKDYAAMGSKIQTDSFGHGSFMTRLLMHVAPIVDIYLIRVAENKDELKNSEKKVAEAIEHAGLDQDWQVDVISMSFGLDNAWERTHIDVSRAIEKVNTNRDGNVLFLASAGNEADANVNFPARHANVIPIYATNSERNFLWTNPVQLNDQGPERLGIYATDVPPSITKEIQEYFPKLDVKEGTSIATAIAAGVVAMTLSYLQALPSLLKPKQSEEECDQVYIKSQDDCAKLSKKKGMAQMLYAMSICVGLKQRFINPVWFWGEKEKDVDIFSTVCVVAEQLKNSGAYD